MRAKIAKAIVFTRRSSIAGNTGCICQIENFCVGTRALVRACAERDVSGLELACLPTGTGILSLHGLDRCNYCPWRFDRRP